MALEPSSVQRDRMLSYGKTKLTLVQFLIGKDPAAIKTYLAQSSQSVIQEGGQRNHQLLIDQVLAGGNLPFQYLIVDSFPSSQALLLAHEKTREIRVSALNEIYGFYFRTTSRTKRVIRGAGILSPTLARWLGTQQIRKVPDHPGQLDPETDPGLEEVKGFIARDLDQPFYMMNLNRYSPASRGRVTGKSAYQRYSIHIIPYLISVGGYPEIYANILGTYIGDQGSSLANRWDDFALVYYPSRASFLRLMTNTPHRAAKVRRAGLEKVVLMPCITDLEDL